MDIKTTHKERTRTRILEEAAKAMRSHGYASVSVADLMKRAGLTHGGFYAHFSSRDDLVVHAIDRMFEDSALMVEHYLTKDAGKEGLAALIDNYLSKRALQKVEKGCPLPSLCGEASRLPAAARERFQLGIDRFQASLSRSLEALGAPNPDDLARSALAEMVGAMALARTLKSDDNALALLDATRRDLKHRLNLTAAVKN